MRPSLLLPLITVLLVLVAAAPASGATLRTYGCKGPDGATPAPVGWAGAGWIPGSEAPGQEVANGCGTRGGFLQAFANTRFHAQPRGPRARWTYVAPPNTRITRVEAWISGATHWNPAGSWGGEVLWLWSGAAAPAGRLYRTTGATGVPADPLHPANRRAYGGLSTPAFGLAVGCWTGSSRDCPQEAASGRVAYARMARSIVDVSDELAPRAVDVRGPLATDGTLRGTAELAVDLDDRGTGVAAVAVLVDDVERVRRTVDAAGGRCRDIDPATSGFQAHVPNPCPTQASATLGIDTRALPEGRHVLRVVAVDAAGNGTTIVPAREVLVDNVPPPVVREAPQVTGRPHEGETLTAEPGVWDGEPTFGFRWQRCEHANGDGCTDIGGATERTYVVRREDAGRHLRVRVTATNPEGTSSADSPPLAEPATRIEPPAAGSPPSVEGVAREGEALIGRDGTWTGEGVVTLERRWLRCDAAGERCAAIAGADDHAYRLVAADVGHRLRLRVVATNRGGSTSAYSAPTAIVARRPVTSTPPPPPAPGPRPSGPRPVPEPPAGGGPRPVSPARGCPAGVRDRVVVLDRRGRTTSVRWGRRAVITGTLERASDGLPVAGGVVRAVTRVDLPGARPRDAGGVRTRPDGGFALTLPPGRASSRVRLEHTPPGCARPVTATSVLVRVRGRIVVRAARRGGRRARLTGRLLGAEVLPSRGVPVLVERRGRGGRWRPLAATTAVAGSGRFAVTVRRPRRRPLVVRARALTGRDVPLHRPRSRTLVVR